jgi:predicted nucleic acid-binding Zn ribbon protein
MVSVQIPQHKHCQNCGKAVRSKETVCSDECKAEWDRMIKKKQYTTYAFLGLGVFVIMMFLLGRGNL